MADDKPVGMGKTLEGSCQFVKKLGYAVKNEVSRKRPTAVFACPQDRIEIPQNLPPFSVLVSDYDEGESCSVEQEGSSSVANNRLSCASVFINTGSRSRQRVLTSSPRVAPANAVFCCSHR